MSAELVKTELHGPGLMRIQRTLEYGSALAKCLGRFDSDARYTHEVFAYVPIGVEVDADGDLGAMSLGGAVRYLPSYLSELFASSGRGVFVFEDVMASPGDGFLADSVAVFVVDGEVYHGLSAGQPSALFEKAVWETAVAWRFLCVCLAADSLDEVVVDGRFDADFIESAWVEIIVGAFDGEGFVHCRRTPVDQAAAAEPSGDG